MFIPQTLNEDLRSLLPAIDDVSTRCQALQQTCPDSRVTSQAAQLSTRYSTLVSQTKETEVRLEQHVDDHRQFEESHERAAAWLRTNCEQLATFGDGAAIGDQSEVQGQLHQLFELLAGKGEGQTLLHAASTWAEKTLVSTASDGRLTIQHQLQVSGRHLKISRNFFFQW